MRLSNSKVPSKVKRRLLMSYKVNVVTLRAPRDDNDNVALMAQGASQDLILHFATYSLTNQSNAAIVFSSQ